MKVAPIAASDDLRPVPILDRVLRKEPDGGLAGSPADMQVGGADKDFVVAVGADDAEGKVFRKHGRLLSLSQIRTYREQKSRGIDGGCATRRRSNVTLRS